MTLHPSIFCITSSYRRPTIAVAPDTLAMAAMLAAAVPSEIGVFDQPREDHGQINQQSEPEQEGCEQGNERHLARPAQTR